MNKIKFRVKKRDGKLQSFDPRKIKKAIFSAFNEINPDVIPNIDNIVDNVIFNLSLKKIEENIFEIETIQDTVEEVLMVVDPIVAKHYILYRQERNEARELRKNPDPLALANYIHFSKYSRYDQSLKRRETYRETVNRVMQMHIRKYPNIITKIKYCFNFVLEKKVLPSMRSMQFAGPAIEQHNARMYNCSFTLIDRLEVFGHILYLLLCGCGVGFSIQWPHVERLPRLNKIGKKVQHYTIEDSIEGWANALNELVFSFISGMYIEFDYSQIRDEGSLLKTSGGIAPGHLPLKKALENIRTILLGAQSRQLRPIECHDIICYSAEAVLAGGIRRSSLISLFSYTDTEMLYSKSQGVYNPITGINAQRAMANNSAVIDRESDKKIFDRIIRIAEEGWGEPGFYFSDDINYGCNPCGEIGLNPVIDGKTGFGFCNLCEINVAAIKDEAEFYEAAEVAAIIGTLQAGYNKFPFLGSTTEQIIQRDALLGVSLTGMMDNPELAFDKRIQRKAAEKILKANEYIAILIGLNIAKRCTTIKPGGTAPLELGGVASGIHPHHARRYFRRVTANPLEPSFLYFRKINPHMVEEKPNGDFCIVFPVQVSSNAKTVKEMNAMEFMELVFSTYDNWIIPGTRGEASDKILTHNVSATIMMSPDEKDEVMKKVWQNRLRIAAMSFAPKMLDKKFPFAPREEVTPADESRWNYLIENYRPVNWTLMNEPNMQILDAGCECTGSKCEL